MAEPNALELRGKAVPIAPLQGAALWLASLRGWRRYLAALIFGILAAGALPPVDLPPLLLIAFPALVWLGDGNTGLRSAFALGWTFGFGYFLAGLYWIAAALFVDIRAFWWLVPFAAVGIPVVLALVTGAACVASDAVCRGLRLSGTARILTLVFFWSAGEWVRGHALTGFPWNLTGYAWSGAFPGGLAILQLASLIGIYGLSLITLLAAALPARLGDFSGNRWIAIVAAILLIAGPAAWGSVRLAAGHPGTVAGVRLRLVQPAIPEVMKSDPAQRINNFRRLFALSISPGGEKATAVLWPEDAAPPFLDRDEGARKALADAAPPNGYVISGTVRTDPAPEAPVHVWNSLVAIDRDGTVRASYDKFHLVPFGEYVPLRGILPMQKITPGAIDFSTGVGPRTITLPGLPSFSPLICYEAIFPGAVIDPLHRPRWLFNITNDAWYGFTSGPFQHLAIARVRAVEEGLPLVRVGNNGISAVFDPYGRVIGRLDLDVVGVLDENLPDALQPTAYGRFRDLSFFIALLLIIVCVAAIRISRSYSSIG